MTTAETDTPDPPEGGHLVDGVGGEDGPLDVQRDLDRHGETGFLNQLLNISKFHSPLPPLRWVGVSPPGGASAKMTGEDWWIAELTDSLITDDQQCTDHLSVF